MSHNRKDNPAGRLHLLLEKVLSQGDSTSCKDAWRKVMQGDKEESFTEAEFLERMSTAYKLPSLVRDIESHILALKANEAQINKALVKIEGVLATYFSGNVKSMRNKLGDSLTTLNMVSGAISTSDFAEPILDDEFLEGTRTELASLYSKIEKSNINAAEKAHLLNLIDLMENAIVEVDVGGAASLHAAASEVVGVLLSESRYVETTELRTKLASLAWSVAGSIVGQGLITAAPALGDGFEKFVKSLPG